MKLLTKALVTTGLALGIVVGGGVAANAATQHDSTAYSSLDACETAMSNQAHHGVRTEGCYSFSPAPFVLMYHFYYWS